MLVCVHTYLRVGIYRGGRILRQGDWGRVAATAVVAPPQPATAPPPLPPPRTVCFGREACEDNPTCRAPGPDARQSQSRYRSHVALFAAALRHFIYVLFIYSFIYFRFLSDNYNPLLLFFVIEFFLHFTNHYL